MIWLGDIPLGAVIPHFFGTYAVADGASITMSGIAVTDIEIFKGVSMTQRASDAGYVLLDTDGIDVDGMTGIHGFSVDTGDNTDAGFFSVGSFYHVVLYTITVDTETVAVVSFGFRLVPAEGIAGHPKVDVGGWLGTAPATPTVNGVPEVDLTHVAGATTDVSALATNVAAILVDTGTTLDGKVDAIKAKTDNLPSDPADASVVAGLIAAVETKVDTVDTVVDAIKVKTDPMTYTVANQLDVNCQSINDALLEGDGAGTPWGPA